MSSLPDKLEALAVDVNISEQSLKVFLSDGREISAPLVWFPRLLTASHEHRRNWRLIGQGIGIHWLDLDEDIAVQDLLRIK